MASGSASSGEYSKGRDLELDPKLKQIASDATRRLSHTRAHVSITSNYNSHNARSSRESIVDVIMHEVYSLISLLS